MIKKFNNVFKFADVPVKIKYGNAEIKDFAADYAFDGRPDIKITVVGRDIERERKLSLDGGNLPDWYYETLAILRDFCVKAVGYDVILFHSSAIAVDDKAYLFTAPSGTGKSNHTRLWRKMLGERAVMVNDDKPFIRFNDGVPYVYGSPWNGKHRISNNISCPVKAICLIEQAKENKIRRINSKEALPLLCRQIFYSREAKNFQQVMMLAGRLVSSTPVYVLECNVSDEAAQLSYNTMNGGNL